MWEKPLNCNGKNLSGFVSHGIRQGLTLPYVKTTVGHAKASESNPIEIGIMVGE